MEGVTDALPRDSVGEIRIEAAEDLRLPRPGAATPRKLRRHRYTWRPPQALYEQMPAGFELTLQCVTGPDRVRRFYPQDSFEAFLAQAWLGGLAVLWQQQNLDGEQLHSYRAMRFLLLRVRRMVEHFRHRFDSSRDLTVVPSGRTEPGDRDVLPDDLGLDARGRGQRWGVKELIACGEAQARQAGYPRPTIAQAIHRGLVEAARRNPLPASDDQVPGLVRAALFDVDWAEEPDPSLVEIVTERLLAALHPHLKDTTQDFEKWFLGPKNSLVHQLAKQRQSPGGVLVEDEVRRVLLHLGWQAYEFAANCLHAQMRTFPNAMPKPLNKRERLYFEHMHLPQPYLGNLPLVLLAPRLGFVKELLWELWEALPDRTLIPVFHRLLDWYSTMAARRREADCLIKQGRPRRFVEAAHLPARTSQVFQELAAEVREHEGIDCGCPQRQWWAELCGRPRTKVQIAHRCIACGCEKVTTLTRQRLKEIGLTLF
jgi:hypothetical protein